MDLASIAGAPSGLASSQISDAVGIAVLKKVIDIETQNALQLIQALPQTVPASNPPNMGHNVDTFA